MDSVDKFKHYNLSCAKLLKHVRLELRKHNNKMKPFKKFFDKYLTEYLNQLFWKGEVKPDIRDALLATSRKTEEMRDNTLSILKRELINWVYCNMDNPLSEQEIRVIEKMEFVLDKKLYHLDDYDYFTYDERNLKGLLQRMEVFVQHIKEFRPWDFDYNINLFADSIKMTAQYMGAHGHLKSSGKQARQLWNAYGQLKNIVNPRQDKTVQYYYSKVDYGWEKCENGNYQFETYTSGNKETLEKMYKLAIKREKETRDQERKDAWDFIKKYGYWWD